MQYKLIYPSYVSLPTVLFTNVWKPMCMELLLQTSPRYCNRTVCRVVPVVVYPERIDLHVVNRVVLPEPHIGLQLERPGPIRGGQFSD